MARNKPPHQPRPRTRRPAARRGFTMTEMMVVIGIMVRMATPAVDWMSRLPQAVSQLSWRLRSLTQTIQDVEELGRDVASMQGGEENEVAVVVQDSSVTELFVFGTATFLGTLAVMLVLIIFLLASGDLFLRKTVFLLPTFADKRRAVDIARQIEREISSYLVTITLINLGLGTVTAAAMYAVGLDDPLVWGILAAVANFIPYLGPVITVFALLLASLLTFTGWGDILLPPALFIVLTALEGNLITPALVGRRLLLNPVVIFLSILILGWLWGIPGVLIAVPMLAVFRIIADRFDPLRPFGEYLSSALPAGAADGKVDAENGTKPTKTAD